MRWAYQISRRWIRLHLVNQSSVGAARRLERRGNLIHVLGAPLSGEKNHKLIGFTSRKGMIWRRLNDEGHLIPDHCLSRIVGIATDGVAVVMRGMRTPVVPSLSCAWETSNVIVPIKIEDVLDIHVASLLKSSPFGAVN